MTHRYMKLAAAVIAILLVWLVALPHVAGKPIVANSIKHLDAQKVDPSAMYYTVREMMQPIFINGECVYTSPSVKEIAAYCRQEKDTLWDESKRLFNPHQMYIDLSPRLYEVKKQLLDRMSADD